MLRCRTKMFQTSCARGHEVLNVSLMCTRVLRPPDRCRLRLAAVITAPASQNPSYLSQARFPDYDILPGQPGDASKALDTSKAQRELGLHLMPLKTSFIDMAVTLIDLGVVTPKQKWEKWQNGKGKE